MGRILLDERGISQSLLAVFVLLALAFVFLAGSVVADVETTQADLKAALDLGLQAATVRGASFCGPSALDAVCWNTADALQAATQAIGFDLPVTVASQGADGATFAPGTYAPPTWGDVTLSGFETSSDLAQNPCPYAGGAAVGQPAVTGTLSLPLHLSLFGVPYTLTVQACAVDTAAAYNGQTFGRLP